MAGAIAAAVLTPVVGLSLVMVATVDPTDTMWTGLPFGLSIPAAFLVGVVGLPLVRLLNAYGRLSALPVILVGALVPVLIGLRAISDNAGRCIASARDGAIPADCAVGGFVFLIAGALSSASGYFVYRLLERRPVEQPA